MKNRYFAFFSPSSQTPYFAISAHEKEEVELLFLSTLVLTIQASQEKKKSGTLENSHNSKLKTPPSL